MRLLMVSTAALLLTLAAPTAFAQISPMGDGSFVGRTRGTSACPSVTLHILRDASVLSGVVFYSNGSGVSTVKGTTDGKTINWVQTSVSGKGPTGKVTGTVSAAGAMDIHLVGTDCELKVTLPVYNDVLNRGG